MSYDRSNDFHSPLDPLNTHHRNLADFKFTGRPSQVMGTISSLKYSHVITKKSLSYELDLVN